MTIEEVIKKMRSAKTLVEYHEAWEARNAYFAKNEEEVDILAGYGEELYMRLAAIEKRERENTLTKAS